MRLYAFQSFAGASGTDYSTFDKSVTYARRAGVHLVFVLEGMHTNGCGGAADDGFFAGGYAQPYNGAALSYQDYVAGLVAHFSTEPTVLAWELVHEATSTSFDSLNSFVADMAQRIKAIDTNHLLGPGTDSGTSAATSNVGGATSNYAAIHSNVGIDFADVHDFAGTAGTPTWVMTNQQIASLLDIVYLYGATGISLADTTAASFTARATLMKSKLSTSLDGGSAGFLIWDYLPGWTTAGFDFDSRAAEPLSGPTGVLARHAQVNP